jgi:hypothetical protein
MFRAFRFALERNGMKASAPAAATPYYHKRSNAESTFSMMKARIHGHPAEQGIRGAGERGSATRDRA